MKKICMLLTVMVLIFLSGCNNSKLNTDKPEEININDGDKMVENMYEQTDVLESKLERVADKPPISLEDKVVEYKESIPFNYVAAFNDIIYLSARDETGEGSFLLKMKVEESIPEKLPIEVPPGMEFAHITTDAQGFLYAVVINKGNSDNCYIWKIDGTSIIQKMDISEYIEKSDWYPWAFTVSGNEEIYLRIGGLDGILFLVFDSEGRFLSKISDEGRYRLLDAVGRGPDGKVYAVLQDETDKQFIAELDGINGCIGEMVGDVLPEGAVLYACVGEGVGSDLLLFSMETGITVYDTVQKEIKDTITTSELPCDTEGKRSLFLPDSRLLLVKQNIKIENEKMVNVAEGTIFYYIATGRRK